MYNKHLEEKFVWGSQIHYVSVQHIFLFNKVTNQADNIKSFINITRELDYWVALFIVQSYPLNKLRKWGLSYSNLAWERHLEDQFSKPDSCASVSRNQCGVGFVATKACFWTMFNFLSQRTIITSFLQVCFLSSLPLAHTAAWRFSIKDAEPKFVFELC